MRASRGFDSHSVHKASRKEWYLGSHKGGPCSSNRDVRKAAEV